MCQRIESKFSRDIECRNIANDTTILVRDGSIHNIYIYFRAIILRNSLCNCDGILSSFWSHYGIIQKSTE